MLLGGFVLMSILSWNLAISETVELSSKCSRIEDENLRMGSTLRDIQSYEQKIYTLNAQVGMGDVQLTEVQQQLLSLITDFGKKNAIHLRKFPAPQQMVNSGYAISTIPVKVEGPYVALIRLLHEIEFTDNLGKVVSVDFEAERNRKTKRRELNATIYLQYINSTQS